MPRERLAMRVLLATPMGEWHRGRPSTRWLYYISGLAWSSVGVELAELSDLTENCEALRGLLGLLPSRPFTEEKRVWKWMN